MKKTTSILLIMISFALFSQVQRGKLVFTQEQKGDTIFCKISNNDIIPRTLLFENNPKLINYYLSSTFKREYVIPPNTFSQKLFYFVLQNKNKTASYQLSKYWDYEFDITLQKYDTNLAYYLPFETGKSFLVHQAYNGTFSHQNKNALDFVMPEGTPIYAARSGLVFSTSDSSNSGCANSSCADKGNYVKIYHSDGTYGVYFHFKHKGVTVKVGDTVDTNTIIGYSGNTGWSSGPHLHFECVLPRAKNSISLKTYFKINDGSKLELLTEKKTYSKLY